MTTQISFGNPEFHLSAGMDAQTARPDPDAPFRVALMGNYSGRSEKPADAARTSKSALRAHLIDRDNFDEVLAKLGVGLRFSPQGDGPEIRIDFAELDDFHPDRIYERVEIFQSLRQTRKRLGDPAQFAAAAAEVRQWFRSEGAKTQKPDPAPAADREADRLSADFLLERVLGESQTRPSAKSAPATEWNSFLESIVSPHLVPGDDPQKEQLIRCVDLATSGLMRGIIHHPEFQELESAWRAAYMLVRRLETGTDLKLYLIDIDKSALADDLLGGEDLTSSGIYKLLVKESVGTAGAMPWAVVASNYTFAQSPRDCEILGRMAGICRQAGAPFIAAASPAIAGCRSIAQTPDPDDWSMQRDEDSEQAWAQLRGLSSSSYIGLALPRFLLRMPYGADTDPIERFEFEEFAQESGHEDYLWGNPAAACALLLAQTFSESGWDFSDGVMQEIDNLPLHLYEVNGEKEVKPCAESLLTERAVERLIDQGLMTFVSFRGRDAIRLVRLQSICSPAQALSGRWSV